MNDSQLMMCLFYKKARKICYHQGDFTTPYILLYNWKGSNGSISASTGFDFISELLTCSTPLGYSTELKCLFPFSHDNFAKSNDIPESSKSDSNHLNSSEMLSRKALLTELEKQKREWKKRNLNLGRIVILKKTM